MNPQQYQNHDFVLYRNREAEVMKTNKNETIEITYPINEFMCHRVRITVDPSQLQVTMCLSFKLFYATVGIYTANS